MCSMYFLEECWDIQWSWICQPNIRKHITWLECGWDTRTNRTQIAPSIFLFFILCQRPTVLLSLNLHTQWWTEQYKDLFTSQQNTAFILLTWICSNRSTNLKLFPYRSPRAISPLSQELRRVVWTRSALCWRGSRTWWHLTVLQWQTL